MNPNESSSHSPSLGEPTDPLMTLLELLQRLDRRTESLSPLQHQTDALTKQIGSMQTQLSEWSRLSDLCEAPLAKPIEELRQIASMLQSSSAHDSRASSGSLSAIEQQMSALQGQISGMLQEHSLDEARMAPLIEQLPKLATTLTRVELALASMRTELATRSTSGPPAPLASNEELLGELRTLWRKQELYVVGLRGSLQTDLEGTGRALRVQIREDLQGRIETSTQAIAAAVRQAVSTSRMPQGPPSAQTPTPRPPIVGVVLLSSVTSSLLTALLWWLLV